MVKRTSFQTNREMGDQLDDLVVSRYERYAKILGSNVRARKTINSGATFGDLDVTTRNCLISDKTQSTSKNFIVKRDELLEVDKKARHSGAIPVLIGKSQECLIAVLPLDSFLGLLVDYEMRLEKEQNIVVEGGET